MEKKQHPQLRRGWNSQAEAQRTLAGGFAGPLARFFDPSRQVANEKRQVPNLNASEIPTKQARSMFSPKRGK